MFFAGTKPQNLENNFVVRQLKKVFRVHPKLEGQSFFIRKKSALKTSAKHIRLQ